MSNRQRYEAIGMLRNMPVKDVAAHFNINQTTIFRLQRNEIQIGDVVDLQRIRRPYKTATALLIENPKKLSFLKTII